MQLPMHANFYVHHKSELGTLILAGACGMMPVTLLTKADNEENYARVDVKKSRSLADRIDVPQGNFLEQKDIDKLRIQMSKEQVQYVLGNPVAENSFEDNTWHYFYALKGGRGDNFEKQLVLNFQNGKLAKMSGDFDVPKDFNVPLDQ